MEKVDEDDNVICSLSITIDVFKGAFGYVYKGKVVSQADPGYEETVALKTMKSNDCVSYDLSNLVQLFC